ncbi:MAG: FG-GAP-like repeat-containing protein [Rhodothermales bacterium]
MKRTKRWLLTVFAVGLLGTALPARAQTFDPDTCEMQGFPYFCTMDLRKVTFRYGSITWGDLDGDGLQDLVYTGNINNRIDPVIRTEIFRNTGDIVLVEPSTEENKPPSITYVTRYTATNISADLSQAQRVWDGSSLTRDLDGDGRLDLIIVGRDNIDNVVTNFFANTFGSNYEFVNRQSLPGVLIAAIEAADIDNDGDDDILVSGQRLDGSVQGFLLRNQQDPFATEPQASLFAQEPLPFEAVSYGSIDAGDYDGDGDMDLLVAGRLADNNNVTRIYRNDAGQFVQAASLAAMNFARARFGDLDSDGDLDVAISGGRLSPLVIDGAGIVYMNNGGSFSEAGSFEGRYYGELAIGDVDLDGSNDLVVSGGSRPTESAWTSFLKNDGSGTSFTEHTRFGGGIFGQVLLGDYDGDADLDILLYGQFSTGGNTLGEFRNEGAGQNNLPAAPANPQSDVSGSTVTLSWDAGVDTETATPALTYNVRVGLTPGGSEVMSSNALPEGLRLLSDRGNVDHNTRWPLRNLEPGTYYWAVQSIDAALAGSPFVDEQSFVIQ